MTGEVLTLGSLFSGIGGLEYGLEMTGRFKTVWQVEKDAYCRKVLAKHWPDVTRYEDVKDVGKENLSAVDVICGGFPCQDISGAGKKEGVGGRQSRLWLQFARIIDEMRPGFVVIENVAVLRKRGLRECLWDIADLGYDAEWSNFPACAAGAPHSRERLFLLAYAHRNRKPTVAFDAETPRLRANAGRVWNGRDAAPPLVRMADGLPNGLDRTRALGNAVVPQCAKVVGEWLLEIHDELTAVA